MYTSFIHAYLIPEVSHARLHYQWPNYSYSSLILQCIHILRLYITRDGDHKYLPTCTEPDGKGRKHHTANPTHVTIRANKGRTRNHGQARQVMCIWWISLSRGPPAHTRRVPISVWYNTLTPKKQTRVPLSSVTAAPADSTPAHSQRKKIRKRT